MNDQGLRKNKLMNIAFHPELKYCYVLMGNRDKAIVCYQDKVSCRFGLTAISTAELQTFAC